jgi:hypothetical protein
VKKGPSPSTYVKPGKVAAKPLVMGGAARRTKTSPKQAIVIGGAARKTSGKRS